MKKIPQWLLILGGGGFIILIVSVILALGVQIPIEFIMLMTIGVIVVAGLGYLFLKGKFFAPSVEKVEEKINKDIIRRFKNNYGIDISSGYKDYAKEPILINTAYPSGEKKFTATVVLDHEDMGIDIPIHFIYDANGNFESEIPMSEKFFGYDRELKKDPTKIFQRFPSRTEKIKTKEEIIAEKVQEGEIEAESLIEGKEKKE